MGGYPRTTIGLGHIEAVARRIRGSRAGTMMVDTTDALYRWDKPLYPQGFNIETAGDHPVWRHSETDVFPGAK